MRLLATNSQGFLERFYSFYDSVIRKIEIRYSERSESAILVRIATRDADVGDKWVCVDLTILGVREFRFCETEKTTYQVLSDGIHLLWLPEAVALEFGYFPDAPVSIDKVRASDFFAIGTSVNWQLAESE